MAQQVRSKHYSLQKSTPPPEWLRPFKNLITGATKDPVKTILRVTITLFFVYLVNKGCKWSDIRALAQQITPVPLLLAFLLGLASLFLQLIRWKIILIMHHLPSKNHIAAQTLFRGFILAFVTPGRIGELFRAMHLATERKSETIVAVAGERFLAVLTILLTSIVCGSISTFGRSIPPNRFFWVATLLLTLGMSTLLLMLLFSNRRIIRLISQITWLQGVTESVERWRKLPLPAIAILSFGAHLLLLLQTALLFSLFGNIDIATGILISGQAYAFMLLLPIFIANIGLREYAFSLFLMYHKAALHERISASIALGAGTFILLFNIMIPAAAGLVWMYFHQSPQLENTMAANAEKHGHHGPGPLHEPSD